MTIWYVLYFWLTRFAAYISGMLQNNLSTSISVRIWLFCKLQRQFKKSWKKMNVYQSQLHFYFSENKLTIYLYKYFKILKWNEKLTSCITFRVLIYATSVSTNSHKAVCWLRVFSSRLWALSWPTTSVQSSSRLYKAKNIT